MNPSLSDVHVNVPLSFLSNAYQQQESAFVASRVFPVIPVQHKSDVYWTFDRSDFNRNQMKKRAPGAESAGGGWKVDATGSYLCDVWSLHKDIDDQTRANQDPAVNLDLTATRWLSTQAMISREIDWASQYFTTGKWNTSRAGVAAGPVAGTSVLQWNDSASTPIQDVRAMKQSVMLTSGGFRCNKMVIGRYVFDVLCDHPDFVDRIKYGQTPGAPAKVTLDAMAALFELDELLVMDSVQNTGPEGISLNAGESNAFIGGKSALLVYTPSSYGLEVPSCGYTFVWNGLFGAAGMGTRIKSFYIDKESATRVEIDAAYAQKLVSADLGGFFATIVA